MTALMPTIRRLAGLGLGLGLVFVLGCGDTTGLGKRYPVSGTVTYQGKPVEKGTINFIPDKPDGRAATGDISNGSYSLTTAESGDGALPGTYKVTVVAKEVDTSELKEIAKGGQHHHDAAFAKAAQGAKALVPPKYTLADTSGLTAEVKAQSNKIDFPLAD